MKINFYIDSNKVTSTLGKVTQYVKEKMLAQNWSWYQKPKLVENPGSLPTSTFKIDIHV